MDGYESILREFPIEKYQISILHGKMKPEDKAIEMDRFKETKPNNGFNNCYRGWC